MRPTRHTSSASSWLTVAIQGPSPAFATQQVGAVANSGKLGVLLTVPVATVVRGRVCGRFTADWGILFA